jgi:hypothetical protein
MFVPDPDFLPIPNPGVRTGSRIRNPGYRERLDMLKTGKSSATETRGFVYEMDWYRMYEVQVRNTNSKT